MKYRCFFAFSVAARWSDSIISVLICLLLVKLQMHSYQTWPFRILLPCTMKEDHRSFLLAMPTLALLDMKQLPLLEYLIYLMHLVPMMMQLVVSCKICMVSQFIPSILRGTPLSLSLAVLLFRLVVRIITQTIAQWFML